METKYPTLRRPKRKLCYLTNPESQSKQWSEPLTLGDVDKMFDDLDSSPHDDDILSPSSPLHRTSDTDTNHSEKEASPVPQEGRAVEKLPGSQMGPEGDVMNPATRSPSPKLDIDLDVPFKAHGPVKTSSPIEENIVVERVEKLDSEKDRVVSPLLFECEDEGKEEEKAETLPTQKPQCNGHVTNERDDSDEMESPPSRVTLSKPKMRSDKNKVEGSSKENHQVNRDKKTQTAALEGKAKAQKEHADPPVSAVRQKPELAAPQKNSESVHRQPSVEVSSMTSFLQKLRDAGQPKPACSRKFLSPVKALTPPPEPDDDDDFLILEDDAPLWFSIPSKTAASKRQRQGTTSRTDKDGSTDKETRESRLEVAPKKMESEQTNGKLGSPRVNKKMKKKGKEKKNEVSDPGNNEEQLSSPEDLPAGELMEQEKPNKKKQRLKKVPSKESEEQTKDTVSRETDEENPPLRAGKKAQSSSDTKRPKSSTNGNKNAKTSRAKSLKGARKVTQGSDAIKEQSEEHTDADDLGSLSDKEIVNSEAQTAKASADGKDKQNKLPDVSESSSEDSRILGKRKRRQTGQWWMSSGQNTEDTKDTDNQPTVKKSKQNNKEPRAAAPSPAKPKKSRVLKRRNQTEPAPSSSQSPNKAKEKKTKQSKNRNTRRDTPHKVRAPEVFDEIEAEQMDEQQQQQEEEELPDQDQDQDGESSPLVLTQRDHSLSSGSQVFQRVYHHASPRAPREQLRESKHEKRSRKPPGNWWEVDGTSEDMESISSQPQQQEPKPRKERKKQSKPSRSSRLGTPKNGNVAVSLKPQGGAPAPSLTVKPPSTPKTVKRSLATFKDIFTSATETPSVVSNKGAGRNNRRKVTERTPLGKTVEDILSMDAGESSSPPDHQTPQDSKCQSENTLKMLHSGPSSMIELEQYEENANATLPPSRAQARLSTLDLCAPPLKPLTLQPKDEANLAEWFKSLWSSTVDNGAEITPDQFDWYFYQGRAMGFLVDLDCGSFFNGKILLGSHMKKPLWVDHSANTVFNLLTSSVSVTIDGSETRFNPGQSFMVPCGHAYSIQNVNAQPAVLYFTRILAESLD